MLLSRDPEYFSNWQKICNIFVKVSPDDQGWEFAHLLILLKSNEQLWAIRSDHSRQMRDEWAIHSKIVS